MTAKLIDACRDGIIFDLNNMMANFEENPTEITLLEIKNAIASKDDDTISECGAKVTLELLNSLMKSCEKYSSNEYSMVVGGSNILTALLFTVLMTVKGISKAAIFDSNLSEKENEEILRNSVIKSLQSMFDDIPDDVFTEPEVVLN